MLNLRGKATNFPYKEPETFNFENQARLTTGTDNLLQRKIKRTQKLSQTV